MKADKRQIDQIIQSGANNFRAVLIYGPDEGLVRERAQALTYRVLGATDDPFRLAELDENMLLKDRSRLSDELDSISMMGGRRLVRIEASDGITPILSAVLLENARPSDTLLLLTGGDLGARSSLRRFFEQAPDSVAIPCYKDNAADIGQLIRKMLQEAGLAIEADALGYLSQNLGEDRGVTRAEIEKLILFAGSDKKRLTLGDVMAVTGNRAAYALEDLYFAITDGDHKNAERYLTLNLAETQPLMIIRGLSRHLARLHFAVARAAQGEALANIIASLRPPLFWTVKARFENQARRLSPGFLSRAIDKINGAEADILRHYGMNQVLLRRAIFLLTEEVRGLGRKD